MKRLLLMMCMIALAGCSSYGADQVRVFINDPPGLLKDQEYAQYRKDLNEAERQYLNKEITYAQYLEEKKDIENGYSQQIQERQESLESR